MSSFPKILTDQNAKESHSDYKKALFDLTPNAITVKELGHLMRIYTTTKEISYRNKILKLLYNHREPELHSFFEIAYKKERYRDMKVYALRGLAQFAEEKEIVKLVDKLKISLAKTEKTTPYNYQEYELLKGKNGLPFLVEQYNYASFKELLAQVNEQYDRMPDAFKGHITTDEHGEIVHLRGPGESARMIRDFFDRMKK
ncbi:hypothetical protein [Chryseobacterium sp. BIGb0232]|uniref:hypothetical protein n=1 Tax=Chryseobacterium sp. BIGb0232 TaxID=2940598 RepID=UPI000F4AB5AE|nr:hypothetical protein [Chryseobacterium sp. BIGb0232]MCS4304141.1 hypothetical protein [Chryseobacterium sp. BIGb0232]ROS17720.1 hypothetical protein EDF65_2101 [Chryseobacterium nakagawai]